MPYLDGEDGMSVGRLVIYGVVTVIAIVSAMLVHRARNKARSRLSDLAKTLGFSLLEPRTAAASGGLPRVSGKRNGRTVDIYVVIREHRHPTEKRSAVAMIVRNKHQLSLGIDQEASSSFVASLAGAQPVKTGDAEFDGSFRLRSNDPAYIAAALLPEVRQRIVKAWQQGARGSLKVDVGDIRYEEPGTLDDAQVPARVCALVDLLSDLAEIVEAYRGPEAVTTPAAERFSRRLPSLS